MLFNYFSFLLLIIVTISSYRFFLCIIILFNCLLVLAWLITTTLILSHTSANPARHRGTFYHLLGLLYDNPGLVCSGLAARSVEVDLAPEGPAYFEEPSFRWIIAFQLSSWRHHFCLFSQPSVLYSFMFDYLFMYQWCNILVIFKSHICDIDVIVLW